MNGRGRWLRVEAQEVPEDVSVTVTLYSDEGWSSVTSVRVGSGGEEEGGARRW